MASLPETLADLFEANRSSRRAGGLRLARAERDQLKGVLKGKSRIALGDVEKEIGNAYRRALDVKLVDIFAGAWSSISAVADLGDTAKYPAGEHHFVPLANHRITSNHQPKVEVLIDGIPLIEFALDVMLQAQFDAPCWRSRAVTSARSSQATAWRPRQRPAVECRLRPYLRAAWPCQAR